MTPPANKNNDQYIVNSLARIEAAVGVLDQKIDCLAPAVEVLKSRVDTHDKEITRIRDENRFMAGVNAAIAAMAGVLGVTVK